MLTYDEFLTEAAPKYTFKRWEEGGKIWGQVNDIKFVGATKEHSRMAMPMRSDDPNADWYQKELADLYAKLSAGRYAPGGKRVRIVKATS
jgi:hypothetical protein